MKNLANCNAVEFLTQTNKIRKAVDKWLTDTDIANIRKNVPPAPNVTDDMTDEEIAKIREEHKEKLKAQSKQNMMDMLDAILEEHPKETLEILGMVCFLEPKEVEKCKGIELMNDAMEVLTDKEVLRFFTSCLNLGQTVTSVL